MVEVSNEQQRCSIRKRPGTEDGKKKSNRHNTCSNEKWTNLKMNLTIRSSRSGHLAVFPGKIVRKMGRNASFVRWVRHGSQNYEGSWGNSGSRSKSLHPSRLTQRALGLSWVRAFTGSPYIFPAKTASDGEIPPLLNMVFYK